MGSNQSSHAAEHDNTPFSEKSLPQSVRGRKSIAIVSSCEEEHIELPLDPVHSIDSDADVTATDDDDDDSSVDSEGYYTEDEEEDEEWNERLRILEDARTLKQVATFFLHPEKSIEADGTACARCYFDRSSAPARASAEEAEELSEVMKDLAALKKLARDYMHPEITVETTDPTACARNYFSRPSAPEQESYEEAEERVRVLEDAKQLKKLAVDYMHPEHSVVATDPTACARNFFSRVTAPEQESEDDMEERVWALHDAKMLKQLAVDYLHPEMPVSVDATAFGRNYFSRASAPEQESLEDTEERARVLAEANMLKKFAVDYLHPELPVTGTDSTIFGRNYFMRASAPEQESLEDAEERALIMEEAKMLKKLAVDYMHPEAPVVTADPTLFGRNYFYRASAPEQEDAEEAEERARILHDAQMLKKLAVDYMHPEVGVTTTDAASYGRNFFDRASAFGHAQMIHTFPPHDDDDYHSDHHHEHLDHFGMDEDLDMFADIRQHLSVPTGRKNAKTAVGEDDEEEGKLSRSPSSVMLFTEESIYD